LLGFGVCERLKQKDREEVSRERRDLNEENI